MNDFDHLTGRELDALVAERVMGMRLDPDRKDSSGAPLALVEVPRFSENPAMARGISFRMEQRHPGTFLSCPDAAPYTAVVSGASGREYRATDASEAVAICRAMLATMAGEGPGIPVEQTASSRSPRALSAAASMLAAKAQPHQPVGILAQAMALQQGEAKIGPARALLVWAATGAGIVPVVAEQVHQATGEVPRCCVEILVQLLRAGTGARAALDGIARSANEELAAMARTAIARADPGAP